MAEAGGDVSPRGITPSGHIEARLTRRGRWSWSLAYIDGSPFKVTDGLPIVGNETRARRIAARRLSKYARKVALMKTITVKEAS